jgi:hypothetical protein
LYSIVHRHRHRHPPVLHGLVIWMGSSPTRSHIVAHHRATLSSSSERAQIQAASAHPQALRPHTRVLYPQTNGVTSQYTRHHRNGRPGVSHDPELREWARLGCLACSQPLRRTVPWAFGRFSAVKVDAGQ